MTKEAEPIVMVLGFMGVLTIIGLVILGLGWWLLAAAVALTIIYGVTPSENKARWFRCTECSKWGARSTCYECDWDNRCEFCGTCGVCHEVDKEYRQRLRGM